MYSFIFIIHECWNMKQYQFYNSSLKIVLTMIQNCYQLNFCQSTNQLIVAALEFTAQLKTSSKFYQFINCIKPNKSRIKYMYKNRHTWIKIDKNIIINIIS